ncbi:hypothetical protein D3C71_981500 [compost metagenome]
MPQELLERHAWCNAAAQGKRVDEAADQMLDILMIPTRNRRTHDDIVVPAPARQENRKRRMKHHEQRGPVTASQRDQIGQQGRVHHLGHRFGCRCLLRAAQPIRREVVQLRGTCELVAPEFQVALIQPTGCRTSLPVCVVGVLDGKQWQLRLAPFDKCLVKGGKLADQNPKRPTVCCNVVQCQEQDMVVGGKPGQRRAHHGVVGQVEQGGLLMAKHRFDPGGLLILLYTGPVHYR